MSNSLSDLGTFDGMGAPGEGPGFGVPALPKITPPEPATKAAGVKYYFSPVPNTSFYRKDGFRLVFKHKIHVTDLLPSQRYLDQEIEEGHDYVRLATDDEIRQYKMLEYPRGTITAEVTVELERKIQRDTELRIIEALQKQGIDTDLLKLQTVETSDDVAARLARSVRSNGATITPSAPEPNEALQRQAAIVGSDKIAKAAASGTMR